MDRRRYLRTLAGLGSVALAGCAGGPTATDAPSASPTATRTATPSATATDQPTPTPSPTEEPTPSPTDAGTATASPTASASPRPAVAAEVQVAPDGTFSFRPESVEVAVGETVRWVWQAGGHNVKPEDVPTSSDWTGSPGARGDTLDAGTVYSHAFEVAGTYEYVCVPHQSLGMTGMVVVG